MSRIARIIYLLAAWILLALVLVQVYLAGMVYVARELTSGNHVDLGHSLPLPMFVMIVSAYLGLLPGRMKRLSWLLLGVYIVQVYVLMWFLRDGAPAVAALHPVLALAIFALSATLALRAWSLVRHDQPSHVSLSRSSATAAD